jgi:hypothetical protein
MWDVLSGRIGGSGSDPQDRRIYIPANTNLALRHHRARTLTRLVTRYLVSIQAFAICTIRAGCKVYSKAELGNS